MKVALITGGNSGIGKVTAVLLAQRGYQVAIAARHMQLGACLSINGDNTAGGTI